MKICHKQVNGRYYYSDFSDYCFQRKNLYFLRVTSNEEINKTIDYVQNTAKISSKEHLPSLIAHSLPGVIVQYNISSPNQLPRSANVVYFSIDHYNACWDAVRKARNIVVYIDSPINGLKIELMMVVG